MCGATNRQAQAKPWPWASAPPRQRGAWQDEAADSEHSRSTGDRL